MVTQILDLPTLFAIVESIYGTTRTNKWRMKQSSVHLALMEGQFLSALIDGSKLIESRFYKVRAAPIGKIKRNDLIVFKQVGKPLFAVGVVAKALSGSLDRKALTFVKANADDIGIDQKPPSLVSLGRGQIVRLVPSAK